MQNLIFKKKFQSALIWLILTHFLKKNSKCVDLVPNLAHFEFFFKVSNFSKCVVTPPNEIVKPHNRRKTNDFTLF